MRRLVWAVGVAASAAANAAGAGETEGPSLSGGNVPWMYEARANVRAPDETLAGMVSAEYREAKDEFTRHELLQRIKPVIALLIEDARATSRVHIDFRGNLGEYDFEAEGFPTTLDEGTFEWFGVADADRFYQVVFENVGDMAVLDVPLASARRLARQLQGNRAVEYRGHGTIGRAAEEGGVRKLYMRVDRLEARLVNGSKIGEWTLRGED